MTTNTPAPVLTKEEKLARIDAQIASLQTKRFNIENDIVVTKTSKAVVLPAIGEDVLFLYGRTTATTKPTETIGTVVAIKPEATTEVVVNGATVQRKTPAQIKVQVGQGFDADFVVIYPKQVIRDAKAAE